MEKTFRKNTRVIRPATMEDFPEIREIFASARTRMAEEGNPGQWGTDGPPVEKTLTDIRDGHCYVVIENEEIIGVFSFLPGDDPTYAKIDGAWPDDRPYGTIHRIAAGKKGAKMFRDVLDFCGTLSGVIRIDTHENNRTMLSLMEKYGFRKCGTIRLENGEPRIAFQKNL